MNENPNQSYGINALMIASSTTDVGMSLLYHPKLSAYITEKFAIKEFYYTSSKTMLIKRSMTLGLILSYPCLLSDFTKYCNKITCANTTAITANENRDRTNGIKTFVISSLIAGTIAATLNHPEYSKCISEKFIIDEFFRMPTKTALLKHSILMGLVTSYPYWSAMLYKKYHHII